jgi:DNA-binding MarR family transcriptional regulator
MAQYRVLAAVAAGEDRAARIAERLELGRPAVSSAVEALSAKGYLKRLEARGDQRAFDLQVTQSGFAALEVVERDMTIALYELCARVSDGESLLRSLAILGAAVDAVHEERRAVGRGSSQ